MDNDNPGVNSSFVIDGGEIIGIGIGDTVYQTVTLSNKITTIGSQTSPGGGGFGPGGPGRF